MNKPSPEAPVPTITAKADAPAIDGNDDDGEVKPKQEAKRVQWEMKEED